MPIHRIRAEPEPLGPSSRRSGLVISEVFIDSPSRADGVAAQFVEVYNSQPWFEDISGWRIRGSVDYTFPKNFVLGAKSFVVVAVDPADLSTRSGLTNVLGPFETNQRLGRKSGRLRLENRLGGVDFELQYVDDNPWPAAAFRGGHSLVLAAPSYGERDPRAWAASEFPGGSPGAAEPATDATRRTIFINEVLNQVAPGIPAFVELYNYGPDEITLSHWTLTGGTGSRIYTFPQNSRIEPRGWVHLTATELGFAPNPLGESWFLRADDRFSYLTLPSPGDPNVRPRLPEVVINEILYHPPSDDEREEFVEIRNTTTRPQDLSGWKLSDAIGFSFPKGTILPSRALLVVARDSEWLRQHNPQLNDGNCLGNFSGTFGNGGEHLQLTRPESITTVDAKGELQTHVFQKVIDEVTYATGGRWGRWSDGGGSSLERLEPNSPSFAASSWAGSDETSKSPWITVENKGVLDNGSTPAGGLELILYGPGECLVDNVEVIGINGTNIIQNPTFDSGPTNWFFQGTHGSSVWEPTEGFNGNGCLRVRATGAGNTGPNRIRTPFRSALATGQPATIRAKVRWIQGTHHLLFRIHGS